jgi:hypothetical protein
MRAPAKAASGRRSARIACADPELRFCVLESSSARVLSIVCVVLPMSFIGAKAACESEMAAFEASKEGLSRSGAVGNCYNDRDRDVLKLRPITQQQKLACDAYTEGMNAFYKCKDEQQKKEQNTKDAAARIKRAADERKYEAQQSELLQHIHDFMDTVRIGMTAAEADTTEQKSFHNPAGWGKTVNTTVTANGTTQQWVYRFPKYPGVNNMYVYLRDGVVYAIQK